MYFEDVWASDDNLAFIYLKLKNTHECILPYHTKA